MSSTDLVMGAAGGSGAPATYIEDVFSTYLYTGNGSTQTINNGIDLAGEGGLNWIKSRSNTGFDHNLTDTARGVQQTLATNTTAAQFNYSGGVTAFTSSGFTVADGNYTNANAATYASWTFRKQPKFFDVVTYTGTGSARTVAHNLGSAPGMMIIKSSSNSRDWIVYHRSNGNDGWMMLNLTTSKYTDTAIWNNTAPTSTVFSVGSNDTNQSGITYVAYLFAHDAGGFGTSGTDNVISCGSFTTDGNGDANVSLGYEAQYVMIKASSASGYNWDIQDIMRGSAERQYSILSANLSAAESNGTIPVIVPTATGFKLRNSVSSTTFIYMAIRRPMKVPTDATTVFKPVAWTGTGTNPQRNTAGFPVDMIWDAPRVLASGFEVKARLIGTSNYLLPSGTSAESSNARIAVDNNVGVDYGNASGSWWNQSDRIMASHYFRRALGFFDQVCYTGTGGLLTLNHNLGVAPELIILKARGTNSFATSNNWFVYCSYLSGTPTNQYLKLNATSAVTSNTFVFGNAAPTSTTFGAGGAAQMDSGVNAVAYLFATCPEVSKVGSYSGTGANTTNQIDCGFTAGARFVMIKRTNATGNWYVFDTARGITSGNDPFLALNTTNAENSSYDCITPYSAGFNINDASNVGLNETGGSYIYLAIA